MSEEELTEMLGKDTVELLWDKIKSLQEKNKYLKEQLEKYNNLYVKDVAGNIINDTPYELISDYEKVLDMLKKEKTIRSEAIQFINNQRKNPQYDNIWRDWECDELINILKEVK